MQAILETAVVGRKGAGLVGLSGHQLAFIPSGTPVTVHVQVGSYTCVSHQGRTGFVLTDDLQPPAPAAPPAPPAALANAERRGAGWAGPVWVTAVLAAIGGSAGTLLAFL